MEKLFDPSIDALKKSLDIRMMNQNIIDSNIANADTPGYRARALEFEKVFREQLGVDDALYLKETDSEHFQPHEASPLVQIYEVDTGVESLDGNTVNRAQEMSKLVKNQILYNASVEMLKKKLNQLKEAIGGR